MGRDTGRVVRTRAGAVRAGAPHRGVLSFRGVPYAAPPVGALRFRAPQPAEPWAGVRDASRPSPVAPQDPRSGYGWNPAAGDDHLTLDVHVSAAGRAARGLPVLVWLHGGGWISGSGSAPAYFPAAWVARGFVVVSPNYRLGFEGFGSVAGAPENRGLLDQVAALRWVAREVAAFGGDPARVTIAGESAGAASVAALLCAPAARGLFSRAIAASVTGELLTVERARRTTAQVAAAARVPATLAGLGGLPPVRLLAASDTVAQDRLAGAAASGDPRDAVPLLYHPVVDGDLVRGSFTEGPDAGGDPAVPLLVNHQADEWTLFSRSGFAPVARTRGDLEAFAAAVGLPSSAVERYRELLPGASPGAVGDALLTDAVFAQPSRRFARAHAARGGLTFLSRFTWRSPALGGRFGATHALDVPFWFGNPEAMEQFLHAVPVLPLARRLPVLGARVPGVWPTPAAAALSRRAVAAWTGFAAGGDPGWPALGADGGTVRVWGSRDALEDAPGPRDALWDELLGDAAAVRR
ncbi:carboxylesterase family protein [Paenibacillus sp. TRM 82003]|uniref:carboxylesterase/lipase family protein n=1 Tax=Kineococcus sp. TRM81007 TaxID=2925831 RepID=UPI001F5AB1D1|nr:carboxylesterase family protein [Kineococcus sp. TRM81007]MCI2240382.1 carboxylesterase family protein [Kineococcus sp. TRM81007]MCI3927442.1 carboxylesterase family protein [Paenibacillus sp. TRM 82003]